MPLVKQPVAAILAAVLAAAVLGGCTPATGDAAACEMFEKHVHAEQLVQREDVAGGQVALAEGARQAGLKADSKHLLHHLTNLATGSDYSNSTLRDLDFTINFMQVGEICEATGVLIEPYEETANYLVNQDLTLEDLVQFREALAGVENRREETPELAEGFVGTRDEAQSEAASDTGLLTL